VKSFKKLTEDICVNEGKKSTIEKVLNDENVSVYEYKTYKNLLDQFAKLNKQFDKIVSQQGLNEIIGDSNFEILSKANRILKFKGLPSLSIIKNKVKDN
jgi:hypothetical protein